MMKETTSGLRITPYKRRYRQVTNDLLFFSRLQHIHLDWQNLEQWLDEPSTFAWLAWRGNTPVGAMATSEPLNHTCWIRLIALHENRQAIVAALWQVVVPALRAVDTHTVYLLATHDWVLPYIEPLGFAYDEHIVTMFRTRQRVVSVDIEDMIIRVVSLNDVASMVMVDNTAFLPPWQLADDELRQAIRIAAACTIAEIDGAVVGYQLSTQYQNSAHLARLAVLPSMQGRGIGAALLSDVLQRFERRSIYTMSVNTQMSNERSQQLYYRFGFRRNGYDLPVWKINL
ncbi:MAG: GNAT family N-acetyltransferase [Chloroflexi bacterium]|nr:MAG: hypothetical protein CUN54_01990 [Phototrophicales bacterium]RMF81379.1 MAG: GNAT family N-acetyltransferase [Chloroflexota bacterium]